MITLTDEQWARVLALIPKLEQKKVAMGIAGNYLTDEQALEAVDIYPLFKPGLVVVVGERYRDDNGILYKVAQGHTTQADWQPSVTPALFVKISLDEWPLFVQPTGAHDAYQTGAQVTFEGKRYISKRDGNVWSPSVLPSAWEVT